VADAEAAGGASRADHALVLGGGISTGVADSISVTHGVSAGLRQLRSSGLALSVAFLLDTEGPLREWHLHANAGWLWSVGWGNVRGHLGALVGGGLLDQAVAGQPARRTGFVDLAPVLGLTTDFGPRFGLWSELELSGALYQRDDRLAFSFMPSAWLGGYLRL
jgi:hypothetical protein